jgi:EAL domain-containing protein (putative c-di-GMP-specific phosphodiesterase class I)
MGYRLGQGFFMARPLPAEEAGALMAVPVLPAA